jgi:superfamily II DNA or RNA helicase
VKQSYFDFLKSKRPVIEKTGFDVAPDQMNPALFLYQRDIVRWALQLGRAALFLECGMGKTFIQLVWAFFVALHTGKPTLLLAPLAVAHQTVLEAKKFGLEAQYVKRPEDIDSNVSIIITNYERLHLFDASRFGGVVLDESSILKNLGGKTFWQLVRTFEKHTFKLACTATPAPNDFVEFSNHSTFLGVMHFKEVLARWFTGDQKLARSAILKKHAEPDWWRWLTSWAVSLSRPGDLGQEYEMAGFDLPPLNIHEHRLGVSQATIDRTWQGGMLLPDTNPNSTTLHKVKRESLDDRVSRAIEIVEGLSDDEPCILWCDTNYEADALRAAFPNAVEVRGSDSVDRKETVLNAFSDGNERLLITKPEIAGFGLNWQHCASMVFVGVSFSFERTYQALRRSYRFGQTREVNAHMIYAETEGNVMNILKEKQKAFTVMQEKMNAAIAEHGLFRDDQNPALTSALGRVPIEIPPWLKSYEGGVA